MQIKRKTTVTSHKLTMGLAKQTKNKINYEIKSFPNQDLPTLTFLPGRQKTGLYFVFGLMCLLL